MANENELSDREREILRLVATGASNKQIAQQLVISTNTVKVHLRNIFAKIEVTSRTEATLYAIREGLVLAPVGVSADIEAGNYVIDKVDQAPTLPQVNSKLVLISIPAVITIVIIAFIVFSKLPSTQPTTPAIPMMPRWHTKAVIPQPLMKMAATVYGDQMFLIGGQTVNGISGNTYLYSPKDDSWLTLKDKPTPVSDISAGAIGGKIFVPGGRLASGDPTNLLEVYDPRTDQWETRASLPVRLSEYSLAVMEGKLYLFGGWDGKIITSSVYEYDPDTNLWQKKTSMPEPRAYAGAAVLGNAIYIFGGYNGEKALTLNESYSPDLDDGKTNPWKTRAPLPKGRYSFGIASLTNIAYIIGGILQDGTPANNALLYIYQSDTWQNLENPPMQVGSGTALVGIENEVYVVGGKQANSISDQNQGYQAIYTQMVPIIVRQ